MMNIILQALLTTTMKKLCEYIITHVKRKESSHCTGHPRDNFSRMCQLLCMFWAFSIPEGPPKDQVLDTQTGMQSAEAYLVVVQALSLVYNQRVSEFWKRPRSTVSGMFKNREYQYSLTVRTKFSSRNMDREIILDTRCHFPLGKCFRKTELSIWTQCYGLRQGNWERPYAVSNELWPVCPLRWRRHPWSISRSGPNGVHNSHKCDCFVWSRSSYDPPSNLHPLLSFMQKENATMTYHSYHRLDRRITLVRTKFECSVDFFLFVERRKHFRWFCRTRDLKNKPWPRSAIWKRENMLGRLPNGRRVHKSIAPGITGKLRARLGSLSLSGVAPIGRRRPSVHGV